MGIIYDQRFSKEQNAKSGEIVHIVMKDVSDQRPVTDIIWFEQDYLDLFAASGLNLVGRHSPLGRESDPFKWVSEKSVSPWVIYVLSASPC